VHEAFGLVVVESLAAGTPVAGVRSGALPELLADERVGALAEPGDEAGLAEAMDRALALGADPATAAVCREHAARYEEKVVLPRYEALYEEALR
jgi:glycosyltransferase involved in cell wall biosynthesis